MLVLSGQHERLCCTANPRCRPPVVARRRRTLILHLFRCRVALRCSSLVCFGLVRVAFVARPGRGSHPVRGRASGHPCGRRQASPPAAVQLVCIDSTFLSFCTVEEGVMHPSSLELNRAVSCVGNGSTAAAFFAAWGRTVRCLFALRPLLGLLVAAAAIAGVAVALEQN